MSQWFDQSNNANKLRQSYLKGFLDISGGGLYMRSDNSLNFYTTADGVTPKLSFSAANVKVQDKNGDYVTYGTEKLAFLKDLSQNVQAVLTALQNTVTANQGEINTDNVFAGNVAAENVTVQSRLIVGGDASFNQSVSVGGDLYVEGNALFNKSIIIKGDAAIDGRLYVIGDVSMTDDLFVNKQLVATDASLNGRLYLAGDASLNSKLFVSNDVSMGAKLTVNSDASFGGDMDIYGTLRVANIIIGSDISGDSTGMSVTDMLHANGGLTASADVSFNHRLFVAQDVSLNAKLFVHQDVSMDAALAVGSNATIGGTMTAAGDIIANADAHLNKRLFVVEDASFSAKMFVAQDATFNTKVAIVGDASLNSKLVLGGDASFNTKLAVGDAATFKSTMALSGDASFNAKLVLGGDASFNTKLAVGDAATFKSTVAVSGDASMNSKLVLGGDASFNAKLSVGQDAAFAAKVAVIGDVSMNSKLVLGGDASFNAKLSVGQDAAFKGAMAINGLTNINGGLQMPSDATANFDGHVTMTKGLTVTLGDISLNTRLFVAEDASFGSKLAVAGSLTALDISANMANINKIHMENHVISTNGAAQDLYLSPTGNVRITAGLTVDGSINFTGSMIRTDTIVEFTKAIDVSNAGTGPAMKLTQSGAQPIAIFYDDAEIALHVGDNGLIGIGKAAAANVQLDVSGAVLISKTLGVTGDYSSAAGNLTLTDGKITTKTLEVTAESTFDAKITMANASNIDMTSGGWLEQW